jgi:hypothetical protein
MLACNTLRIDRDDGSAAADYRIEDDRVESRTLHTAPEGSTNTKRLWQRLTPEQLSSHVMRDTVVARWLRRRMGVHPLIRACSQHFPSAKAEQDRSGTEWRRENRSHHPALANRV